MAEPGDLVSIAHVSRETGIAIDTLRAWERRYGRPTPVRLPSGHRRYSQDDVQRLRRVAELLARGRRPSELLKLGDEELDEVLDSELEEEIEVDADTDAVKRLLEHTRGFRERQLERALEKGFQKLGHEDFLYRQVAPFITAVGDEWERGTLDVRHEHFVSSILHELLRKLAEREEGSRPGKRRPTVVLATLSGERHGLGLAMAAVLLARAGARTYFLGTDTPTDEIAAAVRETDARAVAVSVSLATCGVESERFLEELRERLPEDVMVIAGGRGSRRLRRGVRGVRYFPESLEEFQEWLESRPFDRAAAG